MKSLLKNASIVLSVLSIVSTSCREDEKPERVYPGAKLFAVTGEWNCEFVNCQDVYEFNFIKDSRVDFVVSDVTVGSMAQIALYKEGEGSGDINLFTGTNAEVTCFSANNCNAGVDGYAVNGFVIPKTGKYKFAVTRNYGMSCGSAGEYSLKVTSDINFENNESQVDNITSLAPDEPEQVCVQ